MARFRAQIRFVAVSGLFPIQNRVRTSVRELKREASKFRFSGAAKQVFCCRYSLLRLRCLFVVPFASPGQDGV